MPRGDSTRGNFVFLSLVLQGTKIQRYKDKHSCSGGKRVVGVNGAIYVPVPRSFGISNLKIQEFLDLKFKYSSLKGVPTVT